MTLDKVNPARAGMIPERSVNLGTVCGKPRASGDDPHSILIPQDIRW